MLKFYRPDLGFDLLISTFRAFVVDLNLVMDLGCGSADSRPTFGKNVGLISIVLRNFVGHSRQPLIDVTGDGN